MAGAAALAGAAAFRGDGALADGFPLAGVALLAGDGFGGGALAAGLGVAGRALSAVDFFCTEEEVGFLAAAGLTGRAGFLEAMVGYLGFAKARRRTGGRRRRVG